MSWGTADDVDRTAKILIDAGKAKNPDDARRYLQTLVLQVAVGPEIEHDPAAQAALATVVNAGRRAELIQPADDRSTSSNRRRAVPLWYHRRREMLVNPGHAWQQGVRRRYALTCGYEVNAVPRRTTCSASKAVLASGSPWVRIPYLPR